MTCLRYSVSYRAAFTLVEVLVALAIFALAAAVLASSAANAIRARLDLEEDRARMSDMRLVRQHVLGIGERDELEEGGQLQSVFHDELSWEAEVEPATLLNLFTITLTVSFEDEEEVQKLTVLRPGWGEATEMRTWQDALRDRVEETRPLQP